MITFEYTITDELGIHARPAGFLVKAAGKYKSNVTICKGEEKADAKKIFKIMALVVKWNETITISADGEDEAEAAREIKEILENNL